MCIGFSETLPDLNTVCEGDGFNACEMREKETDCDFSETNGNNNEQEFLDGGEWARGRRIP